MEFMGSAYQIPGFQPYSRDVGNQTLHKVEECFTIVSTDSSFFRPFLKWNNRRKDRSLDETDLPPETVKKYCQTPPPIEELCSILGDDFTLYYGFEAKSSVVTSSNVLQASFEATGRGRLMVEYIQVVQKRFIGPPHNFYNPDPVNRLVKIKWNQICIHEEEGTNDADFKSIAECGLTALLDKLGQYFFTVKAKLTYFNNGLPPLCEDEEKNKAMKVVKRSDLPSVSFNDVWNSILQFFTNNGICKETDVELVFGPEFFEFPDLIDRMIRWVKKNKGIKNKRLGFRYFKSEESLPIWNHLAVYIKISPSEVRKKLVKLPDCHDMRFYLIPPCGFIDKSHLSWIADWTAQRFAYEFKLFEMQILDKGLKEKSPLMINEEEMRNPPQLIDHSQNINQVAANETLKIQKQDEDLLKKFLHIIEEPTGKPPQSIDHSQNINQDAANETLKIKKQGEDLMKTFLHINEEPTGKPPQSIDHSQNINQDAVGQKRDWQHVEPNAGNIHSGSSRSESVPPKRPRAQPPPQREDQQWEDLKPEDWGNIGPLVVVWPVDIHSEYEKNPRNVLEANFPTDIALESNNKVSVYVTLPLRNGRSKKFRLYVGEGEDNATKIVLDLIVMHSNVLKYTNSFLPKGGLVPNFICNNVPCRTNPRTYLLLSWKDTGPLDEAQIIYLFNCFKDSLSEDLFFDKNEYTVEMKLLLLDLAPKHGLKVRHFGDEQKLVDRYICVYKEKQKDVILEVLKVLKMGDFHPKYRLVSNEVLAQMDLNLN